jgi:periplasmic divalent cation tolerance protein
MERVMVYITAPDLDVARRIGRSLVEERLAACANILPSMESFYRWEGAIQHDQEVVLIAKTRAALVDALVDRVATLHPYEVPCIVSLPVNHGYEPFLRWIDAETGAA